MNLYVWESVSKINGHRKGIAFALATSREDAIRQIIDYVKLQSLLQQDFYYDDEDFAELEKDLRDSDSKVYSTSVGFARSGC